MLRRKKQSQRRLDKASADLHSVEEILHGIQNAQTVSVSAPKARVYPLF